jgi:hypothetical protein
MTFDVIEWQQSRVVHALGNATFRWAASKCSLLFDYVGQGLRRLRADWPGCRTRTQTNRINLSTGDRYVDNI